MNDRFKRSKEFSDFVGFHIRALFCVTMIFVALIPSLDDFFLSLKSQNSSLYSRGCLEILAQLGAVSFFSILATVLYKNIFISSKDYIFSKYSSRTIRRHLMLWTIIIMEFCAIVTIAFVVFIRLSAVLSFAESERDELKVKQCLIEELWVQNGAPYVQSPQCVEMLETLRKELQRGAE